MTWTFFHAHFRCKRARGYAWRRRHKTDWTVWEGGGRLGGFGRRFAGQLDGGETGGLGRSGDDGQTGPNLASYA